MMLKRPGCVDIIMILSAFSSNSYYAKYTSQKVEGRYTRVSDYYLQL